MNPHNFFAQLKQRKLVQWAVAYGAAAFALLQGIDIVAQRFGWPEQTMRFVIIALSVGLFVTLVLAWYHGERGAQRVGGTELLILALLLAIGGGFLWRFAGTSRAPIGTQVNSTASVVVPEKSVAVLPFENLSSDKENAYFTDGVQDEILTNLVENRRSESDQPHIGDAIQDGGAAQSARDRPATRRGTCRRRQCATRGQQSAGKCAVDRCAHRRASVGTNLRSRSGRCLRHPKRNRQGDCRSVAGQALA